MSPDGKNHTDPDIGRQDFQGSRQAERPSHGQQSETESQDIIRASISLWEDPKLDPCSGTVLSPLPSPQDIKAIQPFSFLQFPPGTQTTFKEESLKGVWITEYFYAR